MSENDLRLRENGAVERLSDGKTIAMVSQGEEGPVIKYAHHAFSRYCEAILELLEEGPGEDIEAAIDEFIEAHERGQVRQDWQPGDAAPVQDPELGDLTPEYIEWAKVCLEPEAFRRRYRNGLRLTRYEAQRKKEEGQGDA